MNESRNNIIGSILFITLVLFLGIGGFFLTKSLTTDKGEKENEIKEEIVSDEHKIDKEQDFIYYSNDKFISIEPDITYKDVTINLKTAETINRELKTELDNIRNSVKYISDNELDPTKEVMYDAENIYSASERNYESFEYKEYISLLVKDYEFNCYDGSLLKKLRSYVFNVSSGKLLLNNDLLDMYDVNMENVKNEIRTKLQNEQVVEEEMELIKIDETISGLDNPDNYALYIDKYGDLNISYIVKTNQVDYNKTMKLN